MSKHYNLAYRFFDSKESVKVFCDNENKNATPYIRKNKPAHWTWWDYDKDGKDIFIAWYYM